MAKFEKKSIFFVIFTLVSGGGGGSSHILITGICQNYPRNEIWIKSG